MVTATGQEKSPPAIPSTREALGYLYLTCSHHPIFNNTFIAARRQDDKERQDERASPDIVMDIISLMLVQHATGVLSYEDAQAKNEQFAKA
jgi:hypothetical protein